MVRECRPPAREPGRSWLARRSTMATSTPANANSPATISPVGPPPATTTACSAIRSAVRRRRLLALLPGLGHRDSLHEGRVRVEEEVRPGRRVGLLEARRRELLEELRLGRGIPGRLQRRPVRLRLEAA